MLLETAKQDGLTAALKTLTQEEYQIIDLLFGLSGELISITQHAFKPNPKQRIAKIRDTAILKMRAYSSEMGCACKH